MEKKVLIIEDDATQRFILGEFLRKNFNFDCYKAENGRAAKDILNDHHSKIALVISDVQMPVMGGIEILKHIRNVYPTLPVIMMTASTDMDNAVKAMKLGAIDFITKPYDKNRLNVTIANVIKIRSMATEIIRLKTNGRDHFNFEDMIGFDSGLCDVVKLGRKAAIVDLPVLVQGETGTGKELFAKAIHSESKQAASEFVAVNCGAIPTDLVESTLFGHEKGAFTGATEATIGKFREADGGTLFLDEIGELPLAAQVKLLRVLQENEVQPIGAARAVKVNVRIICATHRNLSDDVKKGYFREDLFFRLNILPITLPALRDRIDDIPKLIELFLNKISKQSNIPLKKIDKKSLNFFKDYSWPGNVRELENIINRAFVFSDSDVLNISDFNFQEKPSAYINDAEDYKKNANVCRTLEEVEYDTIKKAMEFHDSNVTHAANSLGMAKSTLYRKLRYYKII
jgi:DNA-binding NtrC family response regulator